MTILRGVFCLMFTAAILPACERSYVEGRVTDVRGEALPGVIVHAPGASAQDLTDGLGRYRLATSRGVIRLAFSKTGYSSGELSIDDSTRAAADMALWPLPLNPGIYMVDDLEFKEATWVVPKEYEAKDGTQAFGAVLPKELRNAPSEPFIVAYRTTRYNARLSRLVPAEAPDESEESTAEMWVEAGTMAAALEAVDLPDAQLLRLQVGRLLEPGIYGVHWGAMSGYTTLDARVFLFRVSEPSAIEPLNAENSTVPSAVVGASTEVGTEPSDGAAPGPETEATPPAHESIEPAAEDAPPPSKP